MWTYIPVSRYTPIWHSFHTSNSINTAHVKRFDIFRNEVFNINLREKSLKCNSAGLEGYERFRPYTAHSVSH